MALSPLLDRRVIDVLAELRRRDLDVVVVETSAEAHLNGSSSTAVAEPANRTSARGAARTGTDPASRLARQVWSLSGRRCGTGCWASASQS